MKLMKTPDASDDISGTLKEFESLEEVTRSIKLLLWENALLRAKIERLENVVGEIDSRKRESERKRAFGQSRNLQDPDDKSADWWGVLWAELEDAEFNHTRLLEHHKGDDADTPGEGRKRTFRAALDAFNTGELVQDWEES